MSYVELVAKGLSSIDDGQQRVEWVALGEGRSGDYDPSDPDDVELLRFDVLRREESGEWVAVDDGSYCTQMPADAPIEVLRAGLESIAFWMPRRGSVKRAAERLSWISPAMLSDVQPLTS
jgi:hypothetical protein